MSADRPERGSPPKLWQQLGRSLLRHGGADTPQNRVQAVLSNIWLHLHPARVRREALRFRHTLCAGGLAFFFFLVTVVSGALLMLHYRPSPLHAHQDLLRLVQEVPFGGFLRGLHRYGGDAMIIVVFVHLLRVVLTGSYKPPREFNWVIGMLLLVLTLAIAFTGYLLPWDQKGYWATTVATNLVAETPLVGADGPLPLVDADRDLRVALLGGSAVGEATLVRFYVLHCFVLPLLAAALMALHFWRVRKDGFSGPL